MASSLAISLAAVYLSVTVLLSTPLCGHIQAVSFRGVDGDMS